MLFIHPQRVGGGALQTDQYEDKISFLKNKEFRNTFKCTGLDIDRRQKRYTHPSYHFSQIQFTYNNDRTTSHTMTGMTTVEGVGVGASTSINSLIIFLKYIYMLI